MFLFLSLFLKSLFVLAFSTVVSLLVNNVARSATNRDVPFMFGISLFLAIYIAVGWAAFQAKVALATAVVWLAALLVALAAANVALAFQGRLRLGAPAHRLADARYALLALAVFSAAQSLTIADIRLPLLDFGNVDVWYYAKLAQIVLDPSADNRPGIAITAALAAHATPSAYLLLGGAALLTGSEVIDTLAVMQTLVLVLWFLLTQLICQQQFRLRPASAAAVAFVACLSGFQIYLVGQYFLAQLLAILCYLALVQVIISKPKDIVFTIASAGSIFYILIMTYPSLFAVYVSINFFFAVAISEIGSYLGHRRDWRRVVNVSITAPLIAIAAAGILDLYHLKIAFYVTVIYSQNSSLGWPFGLTNPLMFVLGAFYPPDQWPMAVKLLGYCALAAGVAGAALVAFRKDLPAAAGTTPAGDSAPRGDARARLALVLLYLCGLFGYLAYYAVVGASYQQWKLAASTLSPLVFVPLALAWMLTCPLPSAMRVASIVAAGAAALAMTVSAFHPLLSWSRSLAPRHAPLQALRELEDDAAIRGFYVFAGSDPRGSSISAQFLNRKPTMVFNGAFAPLPRFLGDDAGPGDLAVVSDACPDDAKARILRLGDAFCVLTDFRLGEGYEISFGPVAGGWVGLTGISPPEQWGAWNYGKRSTISMPVDPQWRQARIAIRGLPFILPDCVSSQRMIVHANGKQLLEVTMSAETTIDLVVPRELYAGRNLIELVMAFPDAVSPESCASSTDPRTLAFAFYRMTVKASD